MRDNIREICERPTSHRPRSPPAVSGKLSGGVELALYRMARDRWSVRGCMTRMPMADSNRLDSVNLTVPSCAVLGNQPRVATRVRSDSATSTAGGVQPMPEVYIQNCRFGLNDAPPFVCRQQHHFLHSLVSQIVPAFCRRRGARSHFQKSTVH
jgi:hypothetical protein